MHAAVAETPAAPAITAPREPLQGAVWIPPNLMRRNRWNRTRFNPQALAELTANIKKHGVLQPVIVRAIEGAAPGEPLYEIVAGERRWRASVAAELPAMPALLRRLTDLEVIELVTIENVQRESLHPLDEANNYWELSQTYGLEALADRIDRSVSHIYQRLKLRDLCEAGQAAMLADPPLHASLAVEVARLPTQADQEAAVAALVKGWAGEPYSVRQGKEYLRKTFMLRLDMAPFNIGATYRLAPNGPDLACVTVGPCHGCTKRTGAHPGLFEETTAGDHCQDRTCFNAKTVAAKEELLQAMRDAGHTVLQGDAAVRVLPTPGGKPVGHQLYDQPCPAFTDSKKPLRDLLGLNFRGVVVVDHPAGVHPVVPLVPDDKVKKALKAKGLLREPEAAKKAAPAPTPAPAPAPTPPAADGEKLYWPTAEEANGKPAAPMTEQQEKAARQAATARLFGQHLFQRLHDNLADGELPLLGLRLALGELLSNTSGEGLLLIYGAHDWDIPERFDDDLRIRIGQAAAHLLGQLLIEAAVCETLSGGESFEDIAEQPVAELARHYGIPLPAVLAQAKDEAEAEVAEQQAGLGQHAPGQAQPPSGRSPAEELAAALRGEATWFKK